jgi:autotransporter-associated beta strand protein
MKLQLKSCRPFAFAALAAFAFAGEALHAQTTHTWLFTAPGNTYNWNDPNSWVPSEGYPNSPGAIVNLNVDITGAQTIRLQEPITVGTLSLGDAVDGSHAFTIASGTGTNVLTFNSGAPEVSAQIIFAAVGSTTNTISANIVLASNLSILAPNVSSQRLTTSGTFDTNGQHVMVTGGANQVPTWSINGDLAGNGSITFTGPGGITIGSTTKTFTGNIILNGTGRGGTDGNSGALTTTSGSLRNATEVTINGAFSGAMVAAGGTWHSGNGSGAANNPGQRFSEHRIILNSGWLDDGGQAAAAVSAGDVGTGMGTDTAWRRGEEFVRDDVETIRLNSGYSLIVVNNAASTAGTILDVETLERSAGASVFMRSSQWATRSRFTFANSAEYLKGAGGAEGSSTMSIIPWMGAGGSAAGPSAFAVYTPNGIRALDTAAGTTEFAPTITAGADHNVNIGTVPLLSSPTTINSLRLTANSTSTMGAGQVLTVASGGVFFATNGSTLGASGDLNAGTLDFGGAEGVIWSNSTNLNTIGASITGTGGLSKAGTGTLILTGLGNAYSGMTYVGGGTLQVGSGFNFSTLGLSDTIVVSPGAQLNLAGGDMILDSAVLQLEQHGLFNGKLTLLQDVNETIGALFFGETAMPVGTYGALGSGANFESDTWFGGPGMLTVVPEPGSTALLLGGFGMMLMGRRRRA